MQLKESRLFTAPQPGQFTISTLMPALFKVMIYYAPIAADLIFDFFPVGFEKPAVMGRDRAGQLKRLVDLKRFDAAVVPADDQ